jgi:transposase InsO family protein
MERLEVRHMGKRWEIGLKKVVLEYADGIGKVSESCREFGVSRSTFYVWRKNYQENGTAGLMPRGPIALHHPKALPQETVVKILELREGYNLGPQRICWYLERYHGIKTSCASVYRTLVRHGVSRMPRNVGRRAIHTHRYAKAVPGHHVQVDVKILSLRTKRGQLVRRFQYTVIDDATRVRALKIYTRHNQTNAVNFIDYVVDKFPFRIHTIRTDRGHEFQALFHWHVEDKGMRHIYIKPRSPELNGKIERSHRTDQEEFYQLLTFKDDVDLNKKLQAWEDFYNFNRPHGSLNGRTPYEVLKSLLK